MKATLIAAAVAVATWIGIVDPIVSPDPAPTNATDDQARPRASADTPPPELGDLEDLPLLTYEMIFGNPDGGFCPPDGSSNGHFLEFAPSHGIGYRESTNTIFISSGGPVQSPYAGEITIPTLVLASSAATMNQGSFTATGGLVDPSEGQNAAETHSNPDDGLLTVPSAFLVYAGRLYGTFEYFYDSQGTQIAPFYSRPLTLNTTGDIAGFSGYTAAAPHAARYIHRMMSMGMTPIPEEWQTALGGPVMAYAGNSYSIVSNQSYGPSGFAIDPEVIGTGSAKIAQPLVFYPNDHATLGGWDLFEPENGEMMDASTQIRGAVIIPGTRTALWFGKMGSTSCYGPAKTDPKDPLIGTPYPDPVTGPHEWCYDPTETASGPHGYPYVYRVWAIDLLDMAAVKAGTKNPWDVVPYGFWQHTFPIDPLVNFGPTAAIRIAGAAYKASTDRLLLGQYEAGCSASNAVIWSYAVDKTP